MAKGSQDKTKFGRIFALGADRVLKINSMLESGVGPFKIARIIQNDWGLAKDVSEKGLINQLARYKADKENSVLLGNKSAAEMKAILKGYQPEVDTLPSLTVSPARRVDVLHHYEDLRELQFERIKGLVEKEKKMPMPISQINKEIETYAQTLDRIQKIQFDLGVDRFEGPVIVSGGVTRSVTQTQTNPDGSSMSLTQTTVEAVTSALSVLQRLSDDDSVDAIAIAQQEANA